MTQQQLSQDKSVNIDEVLEKLKKKQAIRVGVFVDSKKGIRPRGPIRKIGCRDLLPKDFQDGTKFTW